MDYFFLISLSPALVETALSWCLFGVVYLLLAISTFVMKPIVV